ncbi:DNA-directed RNA polymerase I subunit RPA12 [Solea senegalensis]|nr:DNA-directed RNA polymerase I subunit RPA12 [Solea senegalensis]
MHQTHKKKTGQEEHVTVVYKNHADNNTTVEATLDGKCPFFLFKTQFKQTDEMSCFDGNPNFCPECGSVLPLPGIHDTVLCPRCSFCIPVAEFAGQEIRSTVVFNPVEQSAVTVDDVDDSDLKGPVIDRRCSRCNKEGMVYHTRQMRSADEGQTVFFTCVHCR